MTVRDHAVRAPSPQRSVADHAIAVRDWTTVRAVLFDVDGTLYGQALIRVLMAVELLSLPVSLRSVHRAMRVWRAIKMFRAVREELRSIEPGQRDLASLQYRETAKRIGEDASEIERWVEEWIHRRPLKYLRLGRRVGLESFLGELARAGMKTGVLSDYPCDDKLRALGLGGRFSLSLCTTDPEIGAFKPHAAGFLRACDLWGLSPDQVLYVGDRPDVDAAGAAAAGMPCAIVSGAAWLASRRTDKYVTVPFYRRLTRVFDRAC